MPDNPNCGPIRFPDRNQQAFHIVKAGYIALAFDNPGTASLAEVDSEGEETQWGSRVKLVQAYLDSGTTYLGVSVFQKQLVLNWLVKQPWVDTSRIAVMGHSLGSEVALALGVLDDRIKAVVFNDFLCDERRRFCAITEMCSQQLGDGGNWHIVPGIWQDFGFQDLLAAMAPKYLSINEGGAECFLNTVRLSYQLNGVPERFNIHYYPQAEQREKYQGECPLYGMTQKEFNEKISSVHAEDHSFRVAHSLDFLNKVFSGRQP